MSRLLLCAMGLAAVSGVPGVFLRRDSRWGELSALLLGFAASGCGCVAAFAAFDAPGEEIAVPWMLLGESLTIQTDAVSAMFLLPVFGMSLLGSIYGLEYWRQSEHPENGRGLRMFYGLLTAAMALLLVARSTILFLMGWEVMALAAFFLVSTEHEITQVRKAGLVYLITTRVGTLALFAMFALMRTLNGTFAFTLPPADQIEPALATTVFLLGLGGFGLKAGLMPLHLWLPGAHASAPSHVSALMSGVLIKMGIYGLVRLTSVLTAPPVWWGVLLLSLGVASGIFGVVFAIAQHDIKRLLAYHSVENIGIIVMGLGVGVLGRSLGRHDLVVLGVGGALLHVWNHGLFKALLFLSAGAIVHSVGTRELDELGGLAKRMPRTASFFLFGAIAICGLPPLNGFVSELLIYLGLFRLMSTTPGHTWLAGALSAPALALIGALALACFVKAFGTAFSGHARSEHAAHAHDGTDLMNLPMAVLVAACAAIGMAPLLIAPLLNRAVAAWSAPASIASVSVQGLAPLAWISMSGGLLLLLVWLSTKGLRLLNTKAPVSAGPTWDCGYAAPRPAMQYSSSSFAQMTTGLFAWALRPETHGPSIRGHFPRRSTFRSHTPDLVLDRLVLPVCEHAGRILSWTHWVQRGSIHAYILYIAATLIALQFFR